MTGAGSDALARIAAALAAPSAAPAGGSAAAAAVACGAALGAMVARISARGGAQELARTGAMLAALADRAVLLFDADAAAFEAVLAAQRRHDAERSAAISAAERHAVDVPLQIAERGLDARDALTAIAAAVRPAVRGDLDAALALLSVGARVAAALASGNVRQLEGRGGEIGGELRERLGAVAARTAQ